MHKKLTAIMVSIIFATALSCGGGSGKSTKKDTGNKMRGQATGYGTIYDNDTSLARDRAIDDAMNKLVKQRAAVPDLYAVPVSIKYLYAEDMQPVIETSLHRLEKALGITQTGNNYQRLRAVARQVLNKIE